MRDPINQELDDLRERNALMLRALRDALTAMEVMGDSYSVRVEPFDASAHAIENLTISAVGRVRRAILKVTGEEPERPAPRTPRPD